MLGTWKSNQTAIRGSKFTKTSFMTTLPRSRSTATQTMLLWWSWQVKNTIIQWDFRETYIVIGQSMKHALRANRRPDIGQKSKVRMLLFSFCCQNRKNKVKNLSCDFEFWHVVYLKNNTNFQLKFCHHLSSHYISSGF